MKARFFAVVALLLGLAACQSEPELVNPVFDGEVNYSLTVGVQELATRADLDGDGQETLNSAFGAIDYLDNAPSGDDRIDWSDVDLRYILEVYDFQDIANGATYEGKTPIKDRQVKILDKYEPVVFDLRLVPGRKYHFVVFADFVDNGKAGLSDAEKLGVEGIRHKVGATLADIEVIDEAINDEAGDAYFAVRDIEINNSATEPITLTRPYGKLRVVATDLAELNLNVHPGSTVVEYESFNPNTFNAVTGEIDGEYAVKSFTTEYVEDVRDNMTSHYYTAGCDAEKVKAVDNVTERNSHITLFTDYILAENGQSTIHFTMTVNDGKGAEIKTTKFNTEIPVQRNHLTTIIGNVLTTSTEIKITIDDNFENGSTWNPDEDDFDITAWDGKSVKEPAYDAATQTYTIEEPSELAWLADQVNGVTRAAANTFEGKTFKLNADIDLNNEAWTPIGATGKFLGTFDGQNHKVTNLFVKRTDKTPVGLFANGRTIKNLKVNGAEIYGHYKAGVIIGDGLCAKIDNCHVENAIVSIVPLKKDDANHAGGIVGYLSAETEAYVKNCSVKNAEISAFRDVAGIAGCANGASVVTGNTVENVTVTADQTVEYIDDAKDGNAAAVAGRVHEKATIDPNTVGEDVVVIRKVSSLAEFNYALEDSNAGETIYVGNGEIALPKNIENRIIEGLEGGVLKIGKPANIKNVTFRNITMQKGKANYEGIQHSENLRYENCTLNGVYFLYATSVFEKCTFNIEGDAYNVWTYGSTDVDFNECTFNSDGKSVLIYNEGANGSVVDFNKCYFNSNGNSFEGKAAIEIDSSLLKGDDTYTVNINECIVNGFAKGSVSNLNLFNPKKGEKATIVVDGNTWTGNGTMEDENQNVIAYNAEGLNAAIAAAKDGDTIYLADATFEGLIYVSGKSVNLEALNEGQATINGKLGIAASGKTVNVKGIVFENAYDGSVAAGHQYLDKTTTYCIGLYCASVNVENCTFNLSKNGGINFYAINAPERCTVKNSTFNCNGFRPILSKADVTVEGCTFNDQYKYSLQVWGNANSGNEAVIFRNNTINEAGKTSGCADVYKSYVSISKSYPLSNVAFTIEGNTAGYNFVYDDHSNVAITTCSLNGKTIAENQCVKAADDIKEVLFTYEANYTYANPAYVQEIIDAAAEGAKIKLLPGEYATAINAKSNITIEGSEGAVVGCININDTENVVLKNITFDAANAKIGYDGKGNQRYYANIVTGIKDVKNNKKGAWNITIEGCKFTGNFANGGLAIGFNDQSRTSGQSKNITIKGCTFNTTGAYVDIYTYYSGGEAMNIENNTFNSTLLDRPIYLGKYQSSTPVVVKGNAFNKKADIESAVLIQAHSTAYSVSIDASNNTFAN